MKQKIPNIGEVVWRGNLPDWVFQKLWVIGQDNEGKPIHEPAVLTWGSGERFQVGDSWEPRVLPSI